MDIIHSFQKVSQYQRRRNEFENAVNEQKPGQKYQDSRGIKQREQNPVFDEASFSAREIPDRSAGTMAAAVPTLPDPARIYSNRRR
jgi:hypothetical protein